MGNKYFGGILPMHQINKPVLDPPNWAFTCLLFIDSILGSVLFSDTTNDRDTSYVCVFKKNSVCYFY